MTAIIDRRADYVSAVAVELGDLPAEERAELIEELDDHVAALLEDRPEADLVAELGTPRAYAAELRGAAGLDPTPASSSRAVGDVVTAARERVLQAWPWLPAAFETARPGWWVARGVVAAFALAAMLGESWRSGESLVLAAVLTFGSLWLGRRVRTGAWRVGVRVVNVVAVVLVAWVVLAGGLATSGASASYETQYVPNCPSELSNLYAYDAAGRPLQDVRLYDQNGAPFDLSALGCQGGQFAPGAGGVNAYPWPTWSAGVDVQTYGPPSSLAPLPGATVSAEPSGSATPAAPAASPSPTS